MTFEITKDLENEIKSQIEKTEISVSDLSSYEYDNNPYDVEDHLAAGSGCWVWDEEEEYKAQIEECLEQVENGDIYSVLPSLANKDLSDEEELEIQDIVSKYLFNLLYN